MVPAGAVGLETRMPYDLRHSLASPLGRAGEPAEIAAQLGHTVETLFRSYSHIIEELRGTRRRTAEAQMRRSRGQAPSWCCRIVASLTCWGNLAYGLSVKVAFSRDLIKAL
jgi:hypothetical protein